jgi:hypothetical protein
MREVLNHVADGETILLPMAGNVLAADFRRLGARMNTRRMNRVACRPVELAINSAGAFPVLTMSLAGAAVSLISFLHFCTRARRNLE